MRIKKLRLQSFRNHSDSTLELDLFNVIKGGNFQGKSSIGQALSMLLTPSTTGLDATGRGFNVKIQRGATKATITGVVQGSKHAIERVVTLNTNTTGRTDSSTCLDDPEWHPSPFERLLDANRPALSVALNTDRFFTMDEKEQKNLLARLALPSHYDFPEETVTAVGKTIGVGTIDFNADPFAVIDKAYKLLYAERQMVNRQVKDFVIPDALPMTGVDAPALQAKLTGARERQKTLSMERDEAVAKGSEANIKRTRLQGKVDSLNEKIREENSRIERIQGILSDARLKDFGKVADGKAALDKLEQERQKLVLKMERKKANVETYSKLTGVSGEECPTCHQEIDGTLMTELVRKATEELTAIKNRGNEVLQEMKALGDVAGAVKAIAGHESAIAERTAINVVITEKTKLLQDATTELDKLPKETEVLLQFVKPLDEVDAEITDILAKLQPAMAAEERKKEIEAKTEQLKKLQAKAASVDGLVKIFDKDGIKAELLAKHVGGFVDRMNVVMSSFEYKVALDIEPEFNFLVTDAIGVTTPAKELSGSEQLMWLVALQCAVSKAAGIGIVVADKLDTFLPSQRQKINKSLYTLVSDGTLDQVFAIMSDESDTVPNLPNSAFFLVEAGAVRRL